MGLTNSVLFLGWQEYEEMQAVFCASDIVLTPSRFIDPYNLVVIEAMSWSKVIIGSDVCGSVEDRIESGINGFSFPSENVDALAVIIEDLMSHPEKLEMISERSMETAGKWPVGRGVEILKRAATEIIHSQKNNT